MIYQSQGYPLSIHDEIKIVDPQGQNVAMREIGELLVRGIPLDSIIRRQSIHCIVLPMMVITVPVI